MRRMANSPRRCSLRYIVSRSPGTGSARSRYSAIKTSLAANPGLWPAIEKALDNSEYFILLASAESAQSVWVTREIEWWLKNRSAEKILIVLTQGYVRWDRDTGDFDWTRTTAVPSALRGRFQDEPLYVDLGWARSDTDLSIRHSRFRAAVLDLAAALHGKDKEELDGEDVRQFRNTRRTAWAVSISLGVLFVVAAIAAYLFNQERGIARARELAAAAISNIDIDPERSILLSLEAIESSRTAFEISQVVDALRRSVDASRTRFTLRGHRGRVRTAAFNPAGTRIATAGDDKSVRIWDAASGELLTTLSGHTNAVVCVVYSRDGNRLASASWNGTAKIWDAVSGREIGSLTAQ